MTPGLAARLRCDTQITGIDKLHVFGGLLQPFRVAALRECGAVFEDGIAGLNVRFFFCGIVLHRIRRGLRRHRNGSVPAVTIGASEPHGFRRMHRRFVRRSVAGNAACRLAVRVFLRLPEQRGNRSFVPCGGG